MNTGNNSRDDGRRLSRRERAAILVLAFIALAGAGAVELYRAYAPDELQAMAPAPAPAPSAHRRETAAAARPRRARLTRPPARDLALRDARPNAGARDERLKDAVGDLRLLKPGEDKRPNTTIMKHGAPEQGSQAYEWKGPYAGINLGGAAGMSALRTSVGSPPDYFLSQDIGQIGDLGSRNVSPTGFVGGAQLGYDCQRGSLVAGLEADVDALQLNARETQTGSYNSSPANTFTLAQSIRTDWLATVRPRLGFVVGRVLLFGTGGIALTKFKYDEEFTDTFHPALARESLSETRLGWTAGAGAEYALREHWSLKAEYLYADFGKVSTTSMLTDPANRADVFDHSATFNVHLVRLGLNYRF